MTGPSELRVSDEQRERAAQELREHFAAGRITEDELSDRVQTVYSARTEQELQVLLADLPKLPATREQQKSELAERRRELRLRLLQETGGGLGLFVLCTLIWAAAGAHHGSFWPIWVLIFPLLVLLRNGWRLYGPAPDLERVERELSRRHRHDQRRKELRESHRADGYDRARSRRDRRL